MYETFVGLLFYVSMSIMFLVLARAGWKLGNFFDRLEKRPKLSAEEDENPVSEFRSRQSP